MQIFNKTINPCDETDEVYFASSLTLEQFVKGLQELCNKGHSNKRVSITGCIDFYVHLFDSESNTIVIDTDASI